MVSFHQAPCNPRVLGQASLLCLLTQPSRALMPSASYSYCDL